ncbi:hypothetical protein BKA62DRAFT_331964 [Auriculariales sp. MPI-PUGE-AT-0066]|nr:hypothetical protein BKA62DRAFT_331964 [Auriculariales sp. MPI-PUGE-AT-0066]
MHYLVFKMGLKCEFLECANKWESFIPSPHDSTRSRALRVWLYATGWVPPSVRTRFCRSSNPAKTLLSPEFCIQCPRHNLIQGFTGSAALASDVLFVNIHSRHASIIATGAVQNAAGRGAWPSRNLVPSSISHLASFLRGQPGRHVTVSARRSYDVQLRRMRAVVSNVGRDAATRVRQPPCILPLPHLPPSPVC